jgi:hypothetical protein
LPSGDQNKSTPALPSGLRLLPTSVSTRPEILVVVFFTIGLGLIRNPETAVRYCSV